jgi:hypothetical protein
MKSDNPLIVILLAACVPMLLYLGIRGVAFIF